jgi:hypothetical protein
MTLVVKIWICSTFNHVNFFEKTIKFFIPSSKSLSKHIKRFVKLTTQMFLPNLYKSFKLRQVDLFLKVTIGKFYFHIYLWNFPPKFIAKTTQIWLCSIWWPKQMFLESPNPPSIQILWPLILLFTLRIFH